MAVNLIALLILKNLLAREEILNLLQNALILNRKNKK